MASSFFWSTLNRPQTTKLAGALYCTPNCLCSGDGYLCSWWGSLTLRSGLTLPCSRAESAPSRCAPH
eukprot:7352246-Prymnesium_polylepis.2